NSGCGSRASRRALYVCRPATLNEARFAASLRCVVRVPAMASSFVELPRDTNQALGIGQYAIDFMREGRPGEAALRQVERFHLDSIACAVSAIACGTNAPNVLRAEALEYAVTDPARGVPLLAAKES